MCRFTPTCVGNTGAGAECEHGAPVHPHVRGEHLPLGVPPVTVAGSPPRAWGTRLPTDLDLRERRFTPTCVGNTPGRAASAATATVHPHVRGEHPADESLNRSPSGSPPRAWGTLSHPITPALQMRFTPTCVGNTRGRDHETCRESVHPHVRGEHSMTSTVPSVVFGSPPRAWGTHWLLACGSAFHKKEALEVLDLPGGPSPGANHEALFVIT